jgi:hypothetical protein
MTEFANSNIHFKSKNKQSVSFYNTWWHEKINGWKLGDQFFREWFRSGNVFAYRLDGKLEMDEFRRMKSSSAANAPISKEIPLRYLILNPADMRASDAASFVNARYDKALNSYELERLRNPKTKEEIEFKKTLPAETRKSIDKGETPILKLDQERLSAIFCKKQDYEPLAVPMYFPVLFDINLKLQLKKSGICHSTNYRLHYLTNHNGG